MQMKKKKNDPKPKETLHVWDGYVEYWYPPVKEFPKRRGGPKWISDADRKECKGCNKAFTFTARRHHCRTCGEVFCDACCINKFSLNEIGYTGPQRVCKSCYDKLSSEGLEVFVFPKEKRDVYGVQIYHWYRKGVYFTVTDSDTQQKWMQALRECCRYAKKPINENKIQAAAFAAAHRYVWNRRGPWRWWTIFGTEEEMLAELLGYILSRSVVPDLLREIKIPTSKVNDMVENMVTKMVKQGVDQAWPKTLEGVKKVEDELRKKLTPLLGPIGEAERKIQEGIRSGVGDAIGNVLNSGAKPVLEKVLPMLFEPIITSHCVSYRILQNLYKELKKEVKENKTVTVEDFKYQLRKTLWRINYWRDECSVWEKIVEPELYPLEENLRKLGKAPPFSYLSPWRVRWRIQESINNLLKNAWYTIQTDETINAELEKKQINEALEQFYPSLARKYLHDSKLVVRKTLIRLLKDTILTAVQKLAAEAPGVKSTLEQLDAAIPDPVKEFISINRTFDDLLKGVVMDVITKQVDANESIEKTLDEEFTKNSGVTEISE